jgi:hypothetical protein
VALSPEALTGRYAVADMTGDADLRQYVEVLPTDGAAAAPAAEPTE